jgi:hypothetical protein
LNHATQSLFALFFGWVLCFSWGLASGNDWFSCTWLSSSWIIDVCHNALLIGCDECGPTFCSGWSRTVIFLISTSEVAGIIVVYSHTQSILLLFNSATQSLKTWANCMHVFI